MVSWIKKFIIAFLLGVLTFTPWDILMVSLNIVEYGYPDFWGIAWWAPVCFGLTTGGAFIIFSNADRLFHTQVSYQPNHLAFEYLLISGFYLAVLFLRQYPYILSLSLFFVVLLRLILFHHSIDWLFFLFGACLGPTVELLLTSLGLYLFTEPDFLGMPYWLPIFWGNVALAMRRVSWILDPPETPQMSQILPLGKHGF